MWTQNLFLIVVCMVLLVGLLVGSPAMAAAPPVLPEQTSSLYLPVVQRNLTSYARAAQVNAVAQKGFDRLGNDCGWEAGVWALGMARLWQRTGVESYWDGLKFWVDRCMARGASIAHVNDLLLVYAALIIHARQPQPAYQLLADEGASYLFDRAPRTRDGTLIHLAGMVWDDTLIVAIPFLLQMGEYTGEARYLDEAVFQVQRHAAHLQDGGAGLYHHAWSEPANGYSGPSYWGRGNGWALWAQAEVLAALPPSDARYGTLLSAFNRQANALVLVQEETGMWRTVVTRSDFYAETSATALIAAGLLTAVANGQVDGAAAKAATSAELAAWRQVAVDGGVQGVSGPTGPMDQEAAYNAIPIEEFTLYGQGSVLLLGAAAIGTN